MAPVAWVLASGVLLSLQLQADPTGDLTGDYYCGDGRGFNWNFSLRADGSYSFASHGHMGPYADSKGRVRLNAASLTLELTDGAPRLLEAPLPLALVVVRWADRRYLVPEHEGARFAAHVARAWEPRADKYGWFLLRQSDWAKPVRGLPELPERWHKWLLRSPVEARIMRALTRHRAEIDAGSNRNLQPGMLLGLVSKKYGSTDVRVVTVGASSSTIENDYGDPPLVRGGRVTSRAQ